MAEQIHQTCGIMSDNSSLNLFASETPIFRSMPPRTIKDVGDVILLKTPSIYATFYFHQFFSFFSSTRNTTSTVEVLQLQYWYGNLETVFKCLPPLFKVALRQQYLSCLSQVSPDGSDLFVDL